MSLVAESRRIAEEVLIGSFASSTMWRLIIFSCVLLPVTVFGARECKLQLEKETRSSDIFVKVFNWLQPTRSLETKTGTITSGTIVNLECGNGFARNSFLEKSYAFQCTNGKYNQSYPYEELLCRSNYHKNTKIVPISSIQIRSKIFRCDEQNLKLFEMKTEQSSGMSKITYLVCLDSKAMRPKFVFQPSRDEKPPRGLAQEERNDVWGFDGYGNSVNEMVVLSKGYVEKLQKTRTTSLFSEKYNQGKTFPHYFNRGHLAPYADYADADERKATCQYVNAAPQWDAFNKNQWSLVEKEARKMRQKNPEDWEVYTGTYGNIPTTKGPLTLAPFFENRKFVKAMLPVPMLYWKLVYNTKDKTKSKAFVGVNNPEFKSVAEIGKDYKICTPVAEEGKPMYEGSEFFGFTYKCKVDEFLNALKKEKIIKDSFVF